MVVADLRSSVIFVIFLFLKENFVNFHCWIPTHATVACMQMDFWSFPLLSRTPVTLVLGVSQKTKCCASYTESQQGEAEVSVNPLQEICQLEKCSFSFFVDKVHYRSQPFATVNSDHEIDVAALAVGSWKHSK